MRIALTGGAGFIGSHITNSLVQDGHEVSIVDYKMFSTGEHYPMGIKTFYHMDFADLDFEGKYWDIIIHCAAQTDVNFSVVNPIEDATQNIMKSLGMLEKMVKHKIPKIIFLSTGGALYGEARDIPSTEDTDTLPESPYGISKLSLEHYLRFYQKVKGLKVSILRLANVYGPRNKKGVISIFKENAKNNEPLLVYGGEQTRDYIHVSDVVEAVKLMFEHEGTYNVGTGKEVSVLELAQKISPNKDLIKIMDSKKGEVSRSCLSSAKLRKLGWSPKISLEEGMLL